jgi:hypothetical protein
VHYGGCNPWLANGPRTNTLQLASRALVIALFLERHGAVAIPIAFAASIETVALGTILLKKLRRREKG